MGHKHYVAQTGKGMACDAKNINFLRVSRQLTSKTQHEQGKVVGVECIKRESLVYQSAIEFTYTRVNRFNSNQSR